MDIPYLIGKILRSDLYFAFDGECLKILHTARCLPLTSISGSLSLRSFSSDS